MGLDVNSGSYFCWACQGPVHAYSLRCPHCTSALGACGAPPMDYSSSVGPVTRIFHAVAWYVVLMVLLYICGFRGLADLMYQPFDWLVTGIQAFDDYIRANCSLPGGGRQDRWFCI